MHGKLPTSLSMTYKLIPKKRLTAIHLADVIHMYVQYVFDRAFKILIPNCRWTKQPSSIICKIGFGSTSTSLLHHYNPSLPVLMLTTSEYSSKSDLLMEPVTF